VILVGASTARRERYGRPKVGEAAAAVRRRRGQDPEPLVVVTSRSLRIPADLPLLDGAAPRPVVAHPSDADGSVPSGMEGLPAGDGSVDPVLLMTLLHERGASWVVCEGGPGLLGQLAAADLVDEFLLTLSPTLVGGEAVGLLAGADAAGPDFHLHRVLRDGDHLMVSYRRRPG
jgi:riboflavin biosynthesis pyrimidine reductase